MSKLKCSKCDVDLLDEGIKCGSLCGRALNRICLGLSEEIAKDLKSVKPKVFFHCTECSTYSHKKLFDKVSELVSVVDLLQKRIDELNTEIKEKNAVAPKCTSKTAECSDRHSNAFVKPNIIHSREKTVERKHVASNTIASKASVAETTVNVTGVDDALTILTAQVEVPYDVDAAAGAADSKIESKKKRQNKQKQDAKSVGMNTNATGSVVSVGVGVGVAPDDIASSSNSFHHEWRRVSRKGDRKPNALRVIGDAVVEDIEVIPSVNRRWLHISKFAVSTTADTVQKYVASKLECLQEDIVCFKLIKTSADVSKLSFVNFKVGIPLTLLEHALVASKWPKNVVVREFRPLRKNYQVASDPQTVQATSNQNLM